MSRVTGTNFPSPAFRARGERGYVMLNLLLIASLLVVGAAALAPSIALQIRQEREAELIHRAMEYRRAVRRFAKQTGRYPMRIEELEGTNGVRYLRRRYKDPLTGREFRLLHMADIPAAMGTSGNAWSLQSAASGNGASGDSTSADSTSTSGQDSSSTPNAGMSGSSAKSGSTSQPSNPSPNQSNQPFRGGVIIGVASTSDKKTIREFNQRNHYNQWLFFYDPGYDRPFEVQGPTPLTHPLAAQQSQPAPSSPQAGQPPQPALPQ